MQDDLKTVREALEAAKAIAPTRDLAVQYDRALTALDAYENGVVDAPMERYDAGYLGYGGVGVVDWWQDYIRREHDRVYEFDRHQYEQFRAAQNPPAVDGGVLEKLKSESLDAICEVIGAPKEYNDGKQAMREWFLRRLSPCNSKNHAKR